MAVPFRDSTLPGQKTAAGVHRGGKKPTSLSLDAQGENTELDQLFLRTNQSP